jgi:hypothetical protein
MAQLELLPNDWIIPPSCVDPATCGSPPYVNRSKGFTDIFQVWSTAEPFASPPPSPRFRAAYTSDGGGARGSGSP